MAHLRPYRTTDASALLHVFRSTASPNLRHSPDPRVLQIGSYIWARPHMHFLPDHITVLDDGNGLCVGYLLLVPDTPDFVSKWEGEWLEICRKDGIIPADDAFSTTRDPTTTTVTENRAKDKQTVMPDYSASSSSSSNNNNASDPNSTEQKTDDSSSELIKNLIHELSTPALLLRPDQAGLISEFPAHIHIDILAPYQRRGFGTELIDHMLARLRGMNVPGVHLAMDPSNAGAKEFYRKCGWMPWEGDNENQALWVRSTKGT